MPLSSELVQEVAALLGREPRGLEDVPVRGEDGRPMVIRVASMVDGKPFPTLFWLVDRDLCYRIDQAEAGGLIAELQARVDVSSDLRDALRTDHLAYIRLRDGLMSEDVRDELENSGFAGVLERRGVGGISDFTRIRCLHTWYGAHLLAPNTVGRMLDQWWQEQA